MTATSYDDEGDGLTPGGDVRVLAFLDAIGCDPGLSFTHRFDVLNTYDDNCAFAFGIKQIPGTDQYLLPVIIRSNGYGGEWVSNVRVYDKDYEGYAFGFRKPAEYAMEYLEGYIDGLAEYGVTRDKLKIWISGFSRGAAVANNMGQMLDDDSGISPENIFVYGFAVPETAVSSITSAGEYKNLFSICSELDLVPRVPLVEWGYAHYGNTLYLPAQSKSESTYKELLPKMQANFAAIMNANRLDGVTNEPVLYQEKTLDLLISFLMDAIGSPQEYKNEGWQHIIEGLVMNWKHYDNEVEDMATVAINAFVPDVKLASGLADFLKGYADRSAAENYAAAMKLLSELSLEKTLSASKRDVEVLNLLCDLLYCYAMSIYADIVSYGNARSTVYYTSMIEVIIGIVSDGFCSDLFKQHWPESYLAWMRSAAPEKLFTTEMHRITPIKRAILVGDVNGDGAVNKADVTLLNRYVLAPLFVKLDKSAADIDGNGKINLSDVVLLNKLVNIVR